MAELSGRSRRLRIGFVVLKPVHAGPVVLAWEHGLNLGHLLRQGAIVEILRRRGARPVWAISQTQAAQHRQSIATVPCEKFVLPAVTPSLGWRAPNRLKTFADVLAAQGWTDPAWLSQALALWLELYRRLRPQAVVLDYAPVAQLAASVLGLPAIHVSSGFDAPPGHCPPFSAPDASGTGLSKGESWVRLQASVEQAVAACGVPAMAPDLGTMLSYPEKILDCLPQTDPYGPRKATVYAPFAPASSMLKRAQWAGSARMEETEGAVAYLRDHETAQAVLQALIALGMPAVFVWPGHKHIDHGPVPASIRIEAEPLDLSGVLPQASVFIGHGSVGMTTRAVAAGSCHLVVPLDAEKAMVARRVVSQGLGIARTPQADSAISRKSVTDALRLLESEPAYRDASRLASKMSKEQSKDFVETLDRTLGSLGC